MALNSKYLFGIILFFLILLSVFIADRAFSRRGVGELYSNSWSPALIFAERGVFPAYYKDFSDIEKQKDSAVLQVKEFLNMKASCLNSDAERELAITGWAQQDLNSIYTFYLQLAVGLYWKIFGTCWRSVEYFGITQYVISICLVFLIFYRLSKRFWIPIFLILMELIVFRSLLSHIDNIRDFSKVPFIFFFILMSILFLEKKRSTSQVCLYVIGAAITIVIGIGFRTDVKLLIPLVFLIVFVNAHKGMGGLCLRLARCTPLLLFILLFGVFSVPERSFRGEFNHSAHVAILGQTTYFYEQSHEVYFFKQKIDIGSHYLDPFATAIVEAKGKYKYREPINYLGDRYNKLGESYLIESILDLPFSYAARYLKSFEKIYDYWGVICFLLSILLYFYLNSNKSIWFLFFTYLYLTAFQNVQLYYRHFFFMEIFNLIWLAIIFNYIFLKFIVCNKEELCD